MGWTKRYNPNKNPPQEINTIRFFCGLKPVFLINKNSAYLFSQKGRDYYAKDIYPPQEHHRRKIRYVYKAMTDEDKWSEGDFISLPPGLCFGAVTPRYFKSSNPETQKRIEEYKIQGWI